MAAFDNERSLACQFLSLWLLSQVEAVIWTARSVLKISCSLFLRTSSGSSPDQADSEGTPHQSAFLLPASLLTMLPEVHMTRCADRCKSTPQAHTSNIALPEQAHNHRTVLPLVTGLLVEARNFFQKLPSLVFLNNISIDCKLKKYNIM